MNKPVSIKFYTIKDVAIVFRVSEKTIRRWIENGELRAHRLGRQWRIADDDLRAFCALGRTH